MKLRAETLSIEVTRKCNMACIHCLRGGDEGKIIPWAYMERLLSQVSSIGSIVFTGGEPSLVPWRVEEAVGLIRRNKIDVHSFYVATNGKVISESLARSLLSLYAYVIEAGADKEYSALHVSLTPYHEPMDQRTFGIYEGLSFFEKRHCPSEDHHLLNTGNARWNGIGGERLPEESVRAYEEGGEVVVEGDLYLNVDGLLIDGCDWSYNEQENHVISAVDDPDLFFKLLKRKEE